MKDGVIWAEGSPAGLLTDENLSELYDMPISVVRQRRHETIAV
jgi:ABC-type enterochelin transport system ATPase subunit